MNNYLLTDIISFVAEGTVSKKVYENSDIDRDLRWTGYDFDELMIKYSEHYQVDMSSYLWYFHHAEEGNNFGSAFFERQMSWSNIYRSLQNCYSSLPKKVNGIWTIRSIPCQKEGTI
ncbi:MAG: DUF1493 family protein [Saprospiraceae bacterium]|nr:DUF1493 family protein [Candidatus Brachybacter algidus]